MTTNPSPASEVVARDTRAQAVELLERAIHDMKNPLAVVRASLEWLEAELGEGDDVADAVRDAGTAAKRLVTIVEDLEALARLVHGEPGARDPVDLARLVAAAAAEAGPRAAARGVRISTVAPSPLEVEGDEALLARAISAVVETGARYAAPPAWLDVLVRPSAGEQIELLVSVREGDSLVPTPEGVRDLPGGGLAMVLARTVVEAHGGALLAARAEAAVALLVRLPRQGRQSP